MGGVLKRFFTDYTLNQTAQISVANAFGLFILCEMHCKLPAETAKYASWEAELDYKRLKLRRTHEMTKYFFAYLTSDRDDYAARVIEAKTLLRPSKGDLFEPLIIFTERETKDMTTELSGTSQYSAFWGGGGVPASRGRLSMSRHSCFCAKCRADNYTECAHDNFTGRKDTVTVTVATFTVDNIQIGSTVGENSQRKALFRADWNGATLSLPDGKTTAAAEKRAAVFVIPGGAEDFHVGLIVTVRSALNEVDVQEFPVGGGAKKGDMHFVHPGDISTVRTVSRASVVFVSESSYNNTPAILSFTKTHLESLVACFRDRLVRVGGDEVDEEEEEMIGRQADILLNGGGEEEEKEAEEEGKEEEDDEGELSVVEGNEMRA